MIKVAICDDDIQFIYKLEQSIFRFAEMKRIKVDVDGYTSGAEFIQKLQQSERYDLLFLDIELGDSSGIIVGNWIRSQIQYESMQIVFVSAKEMYAMQLFDLRPMNFLVKPIQQERVDYILDVSVSATYYRNWERKKCDTDRRTFCFLFAEPCQKNSSGNSK